MTDPQRLYYRQHSGSGPLQFRPPSGVAYDLDVGDWIRADLIVGAGRAQLAQLGPARKATRLPESIRDQAVAQQEVISERARREDAAHLVVLAPKAVNVDAPCAFTLEVFDDRPHLRRLLVDALKASPVVAVVDEDTPRAWFDQPIVAPEGPIAPGLYTHPFNLARRCAIVAVLHGERGDAWRLIRSMQDERLEKVPLVVVGPDGMEIDQLGATDAITVDGPAPDMVAAGIEAAFLHDVDAVAVVDDTCIVHHGWLDALDRARRANNAGVVVPLQNRGPMAVPLAGESSTSSARRMPPGTSGDIAAALRLTAPSYPPATHPDGPFMITRNAWEAEGRPSHALGLGVPAVVADDCYVWRASGGVEAAGPALRAWAARAERYPALVSSVKPTGLPVQLLAVDLGTWGGSYCTLRLAVELRRFGIAAQVGRLRDSTGGEPLPIGTVLHRHEQTLPDDFCATSGWSSGVLVATHWSTGRLVRKVVAKNPGVVPLAFWQDLEHRFVNPHNPARKFPADQAREYVTIPNRIINAPWQWDEAVEEFKLDGHAWHIPVGVDCATFHPRRGSRGPVRRILAMYRPQTPRRGAQRLLETYGLLHRKYGDRLSLEVFGWSDGLPSWIVSHGYLRQRDVAQLMREVDLLVEPSDFQGFGLPGAEAMASGTPLVSTDTKGVWAYANRESAVIVGESGGCSAAMLANAVGLLVDDPTRARALSLAGRAAALEIDWSVVAARWCIALADIWLEHGTAASLNEAAEMSRRRAERHLCGYYGALTAP